MRTKLNILKSSRINTGNIKTGMSRNRATRLPGVPGSPPGDVEYRLLEDGFIRLLENGDFRILE